LISLATGSFSNTFAPFYPVNTDFLTTMTFYSSCGLFSAICRFSSFSLDYSANLIKYWILSWKIFCKFLVLKCEMQNMFSIIDIVKWMIKILESSKCSSTKKPCECQSLSNMFWFQKILNFTVYLSKLVERQ